MHIHSYVLLLYEILNTSLKIYIGTYYNMLSIKIQKHYQNFPILGCVGNIGKFLVRRPHKNSSDVIKPLHEGPLIGCGVDHVLIMHIHATHTKNKCYMHYT